MTIGKVWPKDHAVLSGTLLAEICVVGNMELTQREIASWAEYIPLLR